MFVKERRSKVKKTGCVSRETFKEVAFLPIFIVSLKKQSATHLKK